MHGTCSVWEGLAAASGIDIDLYSYLATGTGTRGGF